MTQTLTFKTKSFKLHPSLGRTFDRGSTMTTTTRSFERHQLKSFSYLNLRMVERPMYQQSFSRLPFLSIKLDWSQKMLIIMCDVSKTTYYFILKLSFGSPESLTISVLFWFVCLPLSLFTIYDSRVFALSIQKDNLIFLTKSHRPPNLSPSLLKTGTKMSDDGPLETKQR